MRLTLPLQKSPRLKGKLLSALEMHPNIKDSCSLIRGIKIERNRKAQEKKPEKGCSVWQAGGRISECSSQYVLTSCAKESYLRLSSATLPFNFYLFTGPGRILLFYSCHPLHAWPKRTSTLLWPKANNSTPDS